jgi:hypothetical protein
MQRATYLVRGSFPMECEGGREAWHVLDCTGKIGSLHVASAISAHTSEQLATLSRQSDKVKIR